MKSILLFQEDENLEPGENNPGQAGSRTPKQFSIWRGCEFFREMLEQSAFASAAIVSHKLKSMEESVAARIVRMGTWPKTR
jgi:hypothetical protein